MVEKSRASGSHGGFGLLFTMSNGIFALVVRVDIKVSVLPDLLGVGCCMAFYGHLDRRKALSLGIWETTLWNMQLKD